jgi:hypothetical protein
VPGPNTTFAFILATLFGAVFHLIVGGDSRRLALFLLAGWVGFAAGHLAGVAFHIDVLNIGTLRVFTAALGALMALFVTSLLTSNIANRRRLTR